MRVNIGDVRLFVEVVGKKLRAEGGVLTEKPSVVFIHGGPAFDHRTLLPDYEPLQDVAQLIFYDHRGLGRSDHCSSESWNLRTWAADLFNLIQTLGLDRPIVFGQSFGGAVAQQFAVDYPGAYSGLVLSSTSVRIDPDEVIGACRDVGGEELARIAIAHYSGERPPHKFLLDSMKFFTNSSRNIGDIPGFRAEVFDHFYAVGGEGHHFDIRAELRRIKVPVLVVGGDRDPMIPPKQQENARGSAGPAACSTGDHGRLRPWTSPGSAGTDARSHANLHSSCVRARRRADRHGRCARSVTGRLKRSTRQCRRG